MTTPEPKMKGRFTLYETPDGGLHVAYQPDGDDETGHIEIPGPLVKLMDSVKNGEMTPAKAFRALTSLGKKVPSE